MHSSHHNRHEVSVHPSFLIKGSIPKSTVQFDIKDTTGDLNCSIQAKQQKVLVTPAPSTFTKHATASDNGLKSLFKSKRYTTGEFSLMKVKNGSVHGMVGRQKGDRPTNRYDARPEVATRIDKTGGKVKEDSAVPPYMLSASSQPLKNMKLDAVIKGSLNAPGLSYVERLQLIGAAMEDKLQAFTPAANLPTSTAAAASFSSSSKSSGPRFMQGTTASLQSVFPLPFQKNIEPQPHKVRKFGKGATPAAAPVLAPPASPTTHRRTLSGGVSPRELVSTVRKVMPLSTYDGSDVAVNHAALQTLASWSSQSAGEAYGEGEGHTGRSGVQLYTNSADEHEGISPEPADTFDSNRERDMRRFRGRSASPTEVLYCTAATSDRMAGMPAQRPISAAVMRQRTRSGRGQRTAQDRETKARNAFAGSPTPSIRPHSGGHEGSGASDSEGDHTKEWGVMPRPSMSSASSSSASSSSSPSSLRPHSALPLKLGMDGSRESSRTYTSQLGAMDFAAQDNDVAGAHEDNSGEESIHTTLGALTMQHAYIGLPSHSSSSFPSRPRPSTAGGVSQLSRKVAERAMAHRVRVAFETNITSQTVATIHGQGSVPSLTSPISLEQHPDLTKSPAPPSFVDPSVLPSPPVSSPYNRSLAQTSAASPTTFLRVENNRMVELPRNYRPTISAAFPQSPFAYEHRSLSNLNELNESTSTADFPGGGAASPAFDKEGDEQYEAYINRSQLQPGPALSSISASSSSSSSFSSSSLSSSPSLSMPVSSPFVGSGSVEKPLSVQQRQARLDIHSHASKQALAVAANKSASVLSRSALFSSQSHAVVAADVLENVATMSKSDLQLFGLVRKKKKGVGKAFVPGSHSAEPLIVSEIVQHAGAQVEQTVGSQLLDKFISTFDLEKEKFSSPAVYYDYKINEVVKSTEKGHSDASPHIHRINCLSYLSKRIAEEYRGWQHGFVSELLERIHASVYCPPLAPITRLVGKLSVVHTEMFADAAKGWKRKLQKKGGQRRPKQASTGAEGDAINDDSSENGSSSSSSSEDEGEKGKSRRRSGGITSALGCRLGGWSADMAGQDAEVDADADADPQDDDEEDFNSSSKSNTNNNSSSSILAAGECPIPYFLMVKYVNENSHWAEAEARKMQKRLSAAKAVSTKLVRSVDSRILCMCFRSWKQYSKLRNVTKKLVTWTQPSLQPLQRNTWLIFQSWKFFTKGERRRRLFNESAGEIQRDIQQLSLKLADKHRSNSLLHESLDSVVSSFTALSESLVAKNCNADEQVTGDRGADLFSQDMVELVLERLSQELSSLREIHAPELHMLSDHYDKNNDPSVFVDWTLRDIGCLAGADTLPVKQRQLKLVESLRRKERESEMACFEHLISLPAEQFVLLWANKHLLNKGPSTKVSFAPSPGRTVEEATGDNATPASASTASSLSSSKDNTDGERDPTLIGSVPDDVIDGKAYLLLLKSVDPQVLDQLPNQMVQPLQRAEALLGSVFTAALKIPHHFPSIHAFVKGGLRVSRPMEDAGVAGEEHGDADDAPASENAPFSSPSLPFLSTAGQEEKAEDMPFFDDIETAGDASGGADKGGAGRDGSGSPGISTSGSGTVKQRLEVLSATIVEALEASAEFEHYRKDIAQANELLSEGGLGSPNGAGAGNGGTIYETTDGDIDFGGSNGTDTAKDAPYGSMRVQKTLDSNVKAGTGAMSLEAFLEAGRRKKAHVLAALNGEGGDGKLPEGRNGSDALPSRHLDPLARSEPLLHLNLLAQLFLRYPFSPPLSGVTSGVGTGKAYAGGGTGLSLSQTLSSLEKRIDGLADKWTVMNNKDSRSAGGSDDKAYKSMSISTIRLFFSELNQIFMEVDLLFERLARRYKCFCELESKVRKLITDNLVLRAVSPQQHHLCVRYNPTLIGRTIQEQMVDMTPSGHATPSQSGHSTTVRSSSSSSSSESASSARGRSMSENEYGGISFSKIFDLLQYHPSAEAKYNDLMAVLGRNVRHLTHTFRYYASMTSVATSVARKPFPDAPSAAVQKKDGVSVDFQSFFMFCKDCKLFSTAHPDVKAVAAQKRWKKKWAEKTPAGSRALASFAGDDQKTISTLIGIFMDVCKDRGTDIAQSIHPLPSSADYDSTDHVLRTQALSLHDLEHELIDIGAGREVRAGLRALLPQVCITLAQFMEALIRISVIKYGKVTGPAPEKVKTADSTVTSPAASPRGDYDCDDVDAANNKDYRDNMSNGGDDGDSEDTEKATAAFAVPGLAPAVMLSRLLEQDVLPHAFRLHVDEFRETVRKPGILALMRANRHWLQAVFLFYAGSAGYRRLMDTEEALVAAQSANDVGGVGVAEAEAEKQAAAAVVAAYEKSTRARFFKPRLSLDDFIVFCKDCNLFDEFGASAVTDIYVKVLTEPDKGGLVMSFPEFLEALCALSILKMPDPCLNITAKVLGFLNGTLKATMMKIMRRA